MQRLILAALATLILSATLIPGANAASYHAPAQNYHQNNWMSH
jgi:hypothetical protein